MPHPGLARDRNMAMGVHRMLWINIDQIIWSFPHLRSPPSYCLSWPSVWFQCPRLPGFRRRDRHRRGNGKMDTSVEFVLLIWRCMVFFILTKNPSGEKNRPLTNNNFDFCLKKIQIKILYYNHVHITIRGLRKLENIHICTIWNLLMFVIFVLKI